MEPQVIHTDRFGDLQVVQSYHEGPRLIHLLENGCYVMDGGLPVKDAKELRQGIPIEFLQDALDWLEHKDDRSDERVRPITVTRDNALIFTDTGEKVTLVQDVIDFFEPGPFREAALIAFATNLAKEKEQKAALPLGAKKAPTTTDKRREHMKQINTRKKADKGKQVAQPKPEAPSMEANAV